MTIQMVLLPVFVQVALTFALLFWMASVRRGSVSRGETKIRDIALGQPNWPDQPTQISNSYNSQFQVPLLNLKRPQPQFLDSRARLPEKLVSVCHVSC